jgi:peptide/nickel transport system permease protein
MPATVDDLCVTVRRVAARILLIPLWMLLAGFGGATLLKWAPGATVDEREIDPRYSAGTIAVIRQTRLQADEGAVAYYAAFLARVVRGDLGTSVALGRPVSELLEGRIGETARITGIGLMLAWLASLGLAGAWLATGWAWLDKLAMAGGSLLLAVPSAATGVLFLHWQWPAALALGLVLFPRLYAYLHHILDQALRLPHVWLAVAKGLPRWTRAWRHVIPHALPALIPVAGLSISMAIGASVPLEVLCDRPGVGQLAWQSATGRDLPVLVVLTWLVAGITLVANVAGDLGSEWSSSRLGRPIEVRT